MARDARSEVSRRSAQGRRVGGRARGVLLAATMSVGVLANISVLGMGISSAAGTSGQAARTVSLHETGQLHRTSHAALELNEQGSASGTAKGTIYIHLKVVSPSRVTAEVNIYPRGGSLTGFASAGYHTNGTTASFSGALSIVRGTGAYAHAHGSGLSFSGTIQSRSGAVTVHLNGNIST